MSESKFTISRPKSIGQAHRIIVQMQAEITQLRKDKAALEIRRKHLQDALYAAVVYGIITDPVRKALEDEISIERSA